MKKQTEIMVENILGQGIDIHLLGLREQSKLMNMPMDLFDDESYKIANYFVLSTSQV
jgi:choline O-acetyltransferase